MGKRHFALERGGPRRLHLTWRLGYRDFQVRVEGGPARTLSRAELLDGVALALPDGSTLGIRYVRRTWYMIGLRNELHVERDGQPVPGSDGDPRVVGRRAGGLLLVVALVRLAIVAGAGAPNASALGLLSADAGVVLILGALAWIGLRPAVLVAGLLLAAEITIFPPAFLLLLPIALYLYLAWRRMRPAHRLAGLPASSA
jgi:hypothetical protein